MPENTSHTPTPPHSHTSSLRARQHALTIRAGLMRAIRDWFDVEGFLEVQTPVLLETPALELHIDAVSAGTGHLRTSPEFHMKRLLAAGYQRIYQIGPCFRRGERGDLHNPEFTMLEWYRVDADYMDILEDCRRLLVHVSEKSGALFSEDWKNLECGCPQPLSPPQPSAAARATDGAKGASRVESARGLAHSKGLNVHGEWMTITVADAFRRFAGWDPVAAYDADRFNLDLIEKVEPALPRGVPVILKDYPAAAAALSRRKPGQPDVAERWELYLGGLELANAYSELTDAAEQEARLRACADERKALGKEVYPIDEAFLAALRAGLPPCGGIALGFDRLVMLATGAKSLDEVLAFRN